MAYANPGVFLQALQGAAQQHRMVLTKSLTTFATHQRSKTRYDISIQIYTKQSVYMCVYIHCNIYIYIVYVDNEKLINIYKTLQVCKYVYIYMYAHIYIYICMHIYIYICACVRLLYAWSFHIDVCIYIYVHKLIWINDIGSAKTTRSFRRSFIHKRRTAPVFVPFRWWYRSSKYMRYTSP